MAVLTVSQSQTLPFHSATAIDTVKFTNTPGGFNPTAILTLSAAEFDGVHFSTGLQVQASTGINGFVINGASTLSLAGWTFVSWGRTDSLAVNGTAGADSLTGSSVGDRLAGANGNDILRGGQGVDALYGGGNDDTLHLGLGDVAGAETLDGGSGTDRLLIDHSALADLQTSTLTGIEGLAFGSSAGLGQGSATLSGTQIGGASLLQSVTGGALFDRITVIGPQVDLSGLTFAGWDSRKDKITLSGTTGGDVLTGSSMADHLIGGFFGAPLTDTLSGGGGNDTLEGDGAHLYGGGGRDVFRLSDESLMDGQIISGGSGIDTIEVFATNIQSAGLGDKAISGIEVLSIAKSPGFLVNIGLNGQQIGASAGLINTVDFRDEAGVFLNVHGAQIDLTGVSFQRVDTTGQVTFLRNLGADATIIGSSVGDNALYSGGLVTFDLAGADDMLTLLTPVTAGSSFQGGAGLDVIRAEGNADLTQASIAGFEALSLYYEDTTLTLLGSQMAGIQTVRGQQGANPNLTVQILQVIGAAVDLSSLGFAFWGSADRVVLTGTAGADSLTGSLKSDRIAGGAGPDVMTGGAGADVFLFSSAADSAPGQADTITDFAAGTDAIDLTGFAATQTFIGAAAFSGAGNEVRYDAATGILQGDLIGGGAVEWQVILTGAPVLTGADVLT